MVTVAILGLGARGGLIYSAFAKIRPDLMKITALCDIAAERVKMYAAEFDVPEERCFYDTKSLFAAEKTADVMIVATQDRDHVNHAVAALEKGYHILLEKPIALTLSECLRLEREAKKYNRKVVVCHVLRYTAYFRKIKELIDGGALGRLIGIEHTENVAYWHYAHSFIRGNWHDSNTTSPMILQKCCHDMDILQWLAGSAPVRIGSFGSLRYFRRENAPEGSTLRCVEGCKVKRDCPFNAERFYLEAYRKASEEERKANWMFNVLTGNHPSLEGIRRAMYESDYGKCVFRCDNNVVDHQVAEIEFENGVLATLTMSAYTKDCFRKTIVYGTDAELRADDLNNVITVRRFLDGTQEEKIDVNRLSDDFSGHGGGDNRMLEEVLTSVPGGRSDEEVASALNKSLISHVMCFAAEKSRLHGGEVVELAEYIKEEQNA